MASRGDANRGSPSPARRNPLDWRPRCKRRCLRAKKRCSAGEQNNKCHGQKRDLHDVPPKWMSMTAISRTSNRAPLQRTSRRTPRTLGLIPKARVTQFITVTPARIQLHIQLLRMLEP